MKLLIITNLFPNRKEPSRGIFNKQQFIELAKLYDVKVVAPMPWHKSGGIPREEIIGGIEAYHPRYFMTPKVLRSLYGFFFLFGILAKVKAIQKEFDFDCIFATWAYPDGFASALLATILKKPLVIKVHGSDINLHTKAFIRKRLIKYALNRSCKVIAVTEALKKSMIDLGIPASKIDVIQNGVDSKLFKPMDMNECRKKLNIGRNRKVILFAGNFVPVKGVKYLLEAFASLCEKKYPLSLILIGDGPEEKLLKERCKTLAIDDTVKFIGRKAHDEMPEWINSADILCLPSINEGCPNVVLEALSCGKPVVATRVGGLLEIVDSEEVGVLVEPVNPGKLSDALNKALGERWNYAGIRSRAGRFSWPESAARLKNTLESSITTFALQRSGGKLKRYIKSFIAHIMPRNMIVWRSSRCKDIALTFDDGPNQEFTPRVLEILKENNVKATFFLVGKQVEQNKDLAGRIVSDGHSVGLHSYSHYKFGRLDTKGRADEIAKSRNALAKEIGVTTNLFRPPQGAVSIGQLFYCLKNRIVTVLCSVDSMDYLNDGIDKIRQRFAGNSIRGGDIILFHDDNEAMVKALPEILYGLKEKNYNFATVEEMLK